MRNYFESLADFAAAEELKDGLTSVNIGATYLDLYSVIKPGMPLYIYFQGAQRRVERNIKLPIFSGNRIHPQECSRLAISDPALHFNKEIIIGWYAGSKEFATQKVIVPLVLDKLISLAKPSMLVFVGASGGGFASLYFSRLYPRSIALVCNPQTNILKYWERIVLEFLRTCYGIDDIELAAKKPQLTLGIVKNLCWFYRPSQGKMLNRIIYMQNVNDKFHVEQHYSRFMRALGVKMSMEVGPFQQGNVLALMGNWGKGHTAAPGDVWSQILSNLYLEQGSVDELFETGHAQKILGRV